MCEEGIICFLVFKLMDLLCCLFQVSTDIVTRYITYPLCRTDVTLPYKACCIVEEPVENSPAYKKPVEINNVSLMMPVLQAPRLIIIPTISFDVDTNNLSPYLPPTEIVYEFEKKEKKSSKNSLQYLGIIKTVRFAEDTVIDIDNRDEMKRKKIKERPPTPCRCYFTEKKRRQSRRLIVI